MSVYGVCCHVMSRHHYDRKAPDVQAVGPHCAPGAVKMLRQRVDALFAEDRVDEVMSALALQSITTIDDLASRLHMVSLASSRPQMPTTHTSSVHVCAC